MLDLQNWRFNFGPSPLKPKRDIFPNTVLYSLYCLSYKLGPGDCEDSSTKHPVPIPVPHHQVPDVICRNAEARCKHLEGSAVPTCLLPWSGEAAHVTQQGHRRKGSDGSVTARMQLQIALAIVSIYWPAEMFGTIIKPQLLLVTCLSTVWAKAPTQWNSWVPRGPCRNLHLLPEQRSQCCDQMVLSYQNTSWCFTWSVPVLGQPLLSAGRQGSSLTAKVQGFVHHMNTFFPLDCSAVP